MGLSAQVLRKRVEVEIYCVGVAGQARAGLGGLKSSNFFFFVSLVTLTGIPRQG